MKRRRSKKKTFLGYACQHCGRTMVRKNKKVQVGDFPNYVHLHTGLHSCATFLSLDEMEKEWPNYPPFHPAR